MVDKQVVFFVCFIKGLEEDANDFTSVKFKRAVVCPADQVVGVYVLNDAQWTSHIFQYARLLPKL